MLRIYQPINKARAAATYRIVCRLAHKAPIAARAARVPCSRAAHMLKERILGLEGPIVALRAHWHDAGGDGRCAIPYIIIRLRARV